MAVSTIISSSVNLRYSLNLSLSSKFDIRRIFQRMKKNPPTSQRPLPHWIFDVDDDEDDNQIDGSHSSLKNKAPTSLLEELEIDPKHIYR